MRSLMCVYSLQNYQGISQGSRQGICEANLEANSEAIAQGFGCTKFNLNRKLKTNTMLYGINYENVKLLIKVNFNLIGVFKKCIS